MGEEQAITVRPKYDTVDITSYAMTVDGVVKQVQLIQQVMEKVMKKDEHYGTIPGCGDKPTLLKPGAEKLSVTFRLAPSYKITKTDLPAGHREYELVCTLTHIPSGQAFAQGVGSCSTMESKYRFRNAAKKCPECGKEAIIKGKADYGGGWLCFKKKGGCGTKWIDGDSVIEDQADGKVEHDNPADYYNTVLKISKKRSHTDAVLTATAASDIFTQDVEDMEQNGESFKQTSKTGKAKGKGAAGTQNTIDDLLRKKLAKDKIDETAFCQCAKVQTLEDFSAEQVTVMLKLWPQTSAKFYTWQAAQKRQAEETNAAPGQEQGGEGSPEPDGPSVSDTEPSYFEREFKGLKRTYPGKLYHHINSGLISEATKEDKKLLKAKWDHDETTKGTPFPLDEEKPGIEGGPRIPVETEENQPQREPENWIGLYYGCPDMDGKAIAKARCTLENCEKYEGCPSPYKPVTPADAGEDVAF